MMEGLRPAPGLFERQQFPVEPIEVGDEPVEALAKALSDCDAASETNTGSADRARTEGGGSVATACRKPLAGLLRLALTYLTS
jgi:hypothetical protein